jgi:alkaline phosphatase
MLKRPIPFILCFLIVITTTGQTPSLVFAHNDYEKPVPFVTAYQFQADFIEADIFLHEGDLLVAHTADELDKKKSLDDLYLKPLQAWVLKNNGSAFPQSDKMLTLMIDLKTEGVSTLNTLAKKLKDYPALIAFKTLSITISGNVPPPSQWKDFPEFIHFDGRPGISYTEDQLKRIRLISASFKSYSAWNGNDSLTNQDRIKIENIVREVHEKNKPIRFWAVPDFTAAWIKLIELKIDVINTDDVAGLCTFLKNKGG